MWYEASVSLSIIASRDGKGGLCGHPLSRSGLRAGRDDARRSPCHPAVASEMSSHKQLYLQQDDGCKAGLFRPKVRFHDAIQHFGDRRSSGVPTRRLILFHPQDQPDRDKLTPVTRSK